MKYLVIDDNKNFAQELYKKLNKVSNYIPTVDSPSQEVNLLAAQIIEALNNESDTVLVINLNLIICGTRLDFEGISLLKWLRLKKCNHHCIFYSFLSLKQIIAYSALHAIIFSSGVSFLRMPFSIKSISHLSPLAKATKENLLPFFRAEVDLQLIRHELANKWGATRLNWLLDVTNAAEKESFLTEVLKYITPFQNVVEVDKSQLTRLIQSFDAKGKKIIYYDDMAELWKPALTKLFGEHLITFDAKTFNSVALESYINNVCQPGLLLLDLRLKNETEKKHVLEYSGAKLLIELKKKFVSLPIIIFTASNKAETVRQLLKAGADYVWSKEGVDDGIDNFHTFNNTLLLLKEVQKAMSKFENETYELIFKTEVAFSKVNVVGIDNNIFFKNEQLKSSKSILLDTNYLIHSIQNNYLALFFEFLLINKASTNPKKIIILDDVIREIFIISLQDEKKKIDGNGKYVENRYRVPVCRFLIEKLFVWIQEGLIDTMWHVSGQGYNLRKMNKSMPDLSSLETAENIAIEKNNLISRLIASFTKQEAKRLHAYNNLVEIYNQKLGDLLEKAQVFSDLSQLALLHADHTFLQFIPDLLLKGSVVFVSNDNECAYNIGRYFENDVSGKYEIIEKAQFFLKKRNGEHVQTASVVTQKVEFTNKEGNDFCFRNSYSYCDNNKFNSIISQKNS